MNNENEQIANASNEMNKQHKPKTKVSNQSEEQKQATSLKRPSNNNNNGTQEKNNEEKSRIESKEKEACLY